MGNENLLERIKAQQMADAIKSRGGKRIRLRWSTLAECRRSLAKVNNMVLNGEIDSKSANSIYFSANLILEVLKIENEQKERNGKL